MSLSDTDQFLQRLQSVFRLQTRNDGVPIEPTESRKKFIDAIVAELPPVPSLVHYFKPLDGGLQRLGDSMLAALPRALPFRVTFGVIEAREINARAFRSKLGAVSVCINASLPLLLNKLIKLRLAYASPGSVKFYNRGPVQDMKPEDYADLAREVLLSYADSREIRGPYIELDEKVGVIAGGALFVAESFLLGHEIAHLGMTAESFGIPEQTILKALGIKEEERSREIAADILGAALARDAVLSQVGGVLPGVPVGAGRLCELLAVAGDPSPHYASPAMRLRIILRAWFDSDVASQVFIDEMEAEVNADMRRSERLRQSILKRAFEGQLIPQDPTDEAANVLRHQLAFLQTGIGPNEYTDLREFLLNE